MIFLSRVKFLDEIRVLGSIGGWPSLQGEMSYFGDFRNFELRFDVFVIKEN